MDLFVRSNAGSETYTVLLPGPCLASLKSPGILGLGLREVGGSPNSESRISSNVADPTLPFLLSPSDTRHRGVSSRTKTCSSVPARYYSYTCGCQKPSKRGSRHYMLKQALRQLILSTCVDIPPPTNSSVSSNS